MAEKFKTMEAPFETIAQGNELSSLIALRREELAAERARGVALHEALETLRREGRARELVKLELASETANLLAEAMRLRKERDDACARAEAVRRAADPARRARYTARLIASRDAVACAVTSSATAAIVARRESRNADERARADAARALADAARERARADEARAADAAAQCTELEAESSEAALEHDARGQERERIDAVVSELKQVKSFHERKLRRLNADARDAEARGERADAQMAELQRALGELRAQRERMRAGLPFARPAASCATGSG